MDLLTAHLIGIEGRIYNDIWNAVLDRKLRSGTKIEESVLCEIYGISRTVTRKVLIIMEQEGIVSLPPNRGVYVASPSRQEAEQILEAVGLLYRSFAKKLARNPERLTDKDRERLQAHLEAETQATVGQDFIAARRLRGEFAVLLGLLSGNAILAGMMAHLMIRAILALALHQEVAVSDMATQSASVVDGILNGKVDAVTGLIEQNSLALLKSVRARSDQFDTADLRAILSAKPPSIISTS